MPSPARLPLVDALRGFAIAQMIVYHFIYDLTFFGWYGTVMARDPVWIAWRTAITTQFLLLVGLGLVLRAQWGNLVFGAICPALPEQSAKNQWHREVPCSNACLLFAQFVTVGQGRAASRPSWWSSSSSRDTQRIPQ
ncbi:MAG: heparan-alpha-glucosaminide N-acetyltransferase domain-containing protein, partial [Betaproteobacteria bacterium]